MTRSVRLEEDNTAAITDIWILDYTTAPGESSPVISQTIHQSSTDTDFGKPSINLSYGHHDIKFIASKGDSPVLSASSLTWTKAKDTFTLNYPVDVAASSNGNRAPELQRAIGGVKIIATDAVKNGTQKVSVAMKRSLSLTLPSLTPAEATATANDFTITSSQWDRAGLALTTYTLCDDEITTDVVVTVTGSDNTIISQFTITNVSIKKNRITTLTGEVFSRNNGFSVAIDETWDTPLELTF